MCVGSSAWGGRGRFRGNGGHLLLPPHPPTALLGIATNTHYLKKNVTRFCLAHHLRTSLYLAFVTRRAAAAKPHSRLYCVYLVNKCSVIHVPNVWLIFFKLLQQSKLPKYNELNIKQLIKISQVFLEIAHDVIFYIGIDRQPAWQPPLTQGVWLRH